MSIKIEQIDELRKRINVSYEDAKEALENCDGDMLEAIIYLEKNNKVKAEKNDDKKGCFFDKIKALIKKGNNIRFVIKKKEKIVLNLSLNVSILIVVFGFHIAFIGLILALLCGFRVKFETNKGEDIKINQTLDKVQNEIQEIKNDLVG
ncbi:hypothetical protein JOC70_002461 [Clostridium pascui]|uniref:DUF4342 domain-containing protein n=1 Tax=Clostridium pascui TaxID=46609 RepID=UPI00195B14A1|nr:DUF4342 domain-containing protein [Clostridium pascui]MBM7870967.1 hypothetical protein [Clostridium pascui]